MTNPNATVDRNVYGTVEFNGLENGHAYHAQPREVEVDWTSKQLARITRLRLLSDPGFPVWDVSYCHGVLKDGTLCRVELPFSQLPKRNYRGAIVDYAKKDGLYAKGLGILDAISTLN